jgi:hypothetical protein
LITASDGNLSDSQVIKVTILRNDTTFLNSFDDGLKIKSFNSTYSSAITIANDSRIWISDIKLKAEAEKDETSFQNNGIVIQANEYNISSTLIVDKNWSSYYSAGASTGAIVELQNNSLTSNLGHIVVRLRLKIGNSGHGRFGLYNYQTGYYEIVTSTIPAFNETYRDIYFDIYKTSPLWSTNDTHFNMKVDNINNFISMTTIRWYYRYIDDYYADQKIYESEVKFIDDPVYPENVSLDFNDDGSIEYFFEGELHENFVMLDHFNNSNTDETLSFTNGSELRYLKIPKNIDLLSAIISFGNSTNVSDINMTFINEFDSFIFSNFSSLAHNECTFWNETNSVSITHMHFWVYCPSHRANPNDNWWHKADIDNDNKTEYYMLVGEHYKAEARCDLRIIYDPPEYYVDAFEFDDVNVPEPKDGEWDDDYEEAWWEINFTSPQSSFYYPKWDCHTTYPEWRTFPSGYLKTDDDEHYLVLYCGMDSDCSVDEYCNKSAGLSNPTQFTCDAPTCDPACNEYENETYSNHECSCQLKTGRCNETNTQISEYYFCDAYNYIEEIETDIYVNNILTYGIPERDLLEIDLMMYIEDYLVSCLEDEFGFCYVPINFTSEWNTSIIVNQIEVTYEIPKFDIKDQFQQHLLSCSGECEIPLEFSTNQGTVNITNLSIYYSPNSKPYFVTDSTVFGTINDSILIEARDPESEDLLNITSNLSNFYQINNSHLVWDTNSTDNGTYSVLFHVDDGILESEQILTIIISLNGSGSTSLNLNSIYPFENINVNKNEFFNYETQICCDGQNCGNITVYLDPEDQKLAKSESKIDYTSNSKTTCNDGKCTKVLYGGTRFVHEDNQWKKIEDARSLKGVIDLIIDEDPNYPIKVIDFNYSSITLDLQISNNDYLNTDVPLKILNKYNESDKLRDKFDQVVDKDQLLEFNSIDSKQDLVIDLSETQQGLLGVKIKWGHNSTTIILNSSDGSFLEDAMFSENTTKTGSNGIIYAQYCDGGGYVSFYKIDLSSIPYGSTIDNASICLYKISGDSSGPVDFWYSNNLTWKEEDIDDLCGNGVYCNDVNDFMDEFIYTAQTGSQMNCFYDNNLTSKFNSKYGNDNFTVVLNVTSIGSDYGWPTKEYGGPTSYLPYVEITYSESNQSTTIKNHSLVSTSDGDTPFYTNGSNPQTINIGDGECQNVNWCVNSTGSINSTHLFYAFANLTSDMTINGESDEQNLTIIESGSLPSSLYIDFQYPTQDINVNQNSFFNVTNKVCCYDNDCGNVNVSLDPEQISYTPLKD